jgi:hypothetical protein
MANENIIKLSEGFGEGAVGDVLTLKDENTVGWQTPQGGDYVPLSATNVAIGTNNTAEYCAFAQGGNNNAQKNGVAIGAANTADTNSFTQGEYCKGNTKGLAQGSSATANTNSFSQGERTYAVNGSLAQGLGVSATQYSIAQGSNVSATNNAQAFGEGIRISAGMAIGKYNDTTSGALFVIGNGTSDANRSDAFIIYPNGGISATGNVSATGDMYTSGGQVVTDVMLTSATNSTTSFVTNGVADLTPLYTYIKSLEDRIAALEAAAVTLPVVNGDNPTVNGDNPII